MKNLLTLSLALAVSVGAYAQTWTYPSSGVTSFPGEVRSNNAFTLSGAGSMGLQNTYDVFLYANQYLKFGGGGGSTTHLTIHPGGNVGIGTSSPSAKLEVIGEIRNDTRYILTGAGTFEKAATNDIRLNGNNKILFSGGGTGASHMILTADGRLGINATNISERLVVGGSILCKEVRVTVDAGSDFVFDSNYNLPSIDEVERFIKKNHHLPDVAPASEMEANGIELAKMDMKLLQKIEELTLYVISSKKEIDELKNEIKTLKAAK